MARSWFASPRRRPIGESSADNPVFRAARGAAAPGLLRGPLSPGGPALVSAYRTTTKPSLIVGVSLSQADVLADWNRAARLSAAILAALGGTVALGLWLAFRQLDAHDAALAALQRAQRLESVAHLTGGVAHDFNNILMVVLGNVDRLRQESLSPTARMPPTRSRQPPAGPRTSPTACWPSRGGSRCSRESWT